MKATDLIQLVNQIRSSNAQIHYIWKQIFLAVSESKKWTLINRREIPGHCICEETRKYFTELGYSFWGWNETHSCLKFCQKADRENLWTKSEQDLPNEEK